MQIAVNTLPFWSRFLLPFDLRYDGTNCQRTVITRGTRLRVFDYRQGEARAQALGGAQATARDTILVNAAQTRGGSRFSISGLSITMDGKAYTEADTEGLQHELWPSSGVQPCNGDSGPLVMSVEDERSMSSLFLQAFLQAFRVQLNVDGTKRAIEMGPPGFYPGTGGAKDTVDASNGDTFVSNYMPIPEGIQWNPSGSVDSNIIVTLEADYDVILPCWTTPTGTANGEAVSQENPEIPYANRTALGRDWRQGFFLNFHGREESPVSNVS